MLNNYDPGTFSSHPWPAGSITASSADAHRFVELWERAGYVSGAEAAAWRERIAIWGRFRRCGQQQMTPVIDPLLDDPDPFLP